MPGIALTFLWFGVGFEIDMGKVNLTDTLWPSSRMILVAWDATTRGLITTIAAVAINCLIYAGVALFLRGVFLRLSAFRRQKI